MSIVPLVIPDSSDLPEVAQRIIAEARSIIEQRGEAALRVTELAERCEVAVGLLYHYFKDRNDIIANVRAQQFVEIAARDIDNFMNAVTANTTSTDLGNDTISIFGGVEEPQRVVSRWNRLAVLSAARHNPDLWNRIADEQAKLNEALVSTIELGQTMGLVNPNLDAKAIALMVEAIPLGLVLSDLSPERRPSPEAWRDLAIRVIFSFAPDA
jgi:AcrR family transcriptional regulator